jgi:hypothetical protein
MNKYSHIIDHRLIFNVPNWIHLIRSLYLTEKIINFIDQVLIQKDIIKSNRILQIKNGNLKIN